MQKKFTYLFKSALGLMACLIGFDTFAQIQQYTSNDSYTVANTVPNGTKVKVQAWGAGANGTMGNGGGGGGAYAAKMYTMGTDVWSGSVFSFTVGTVGATTHESIINVSHYIARVNAIGSTVVKAVGATNINGGLASNCIGDIKYSGANGWNNASAGANGGGSAFKDKDATIRFGKGEGGMCGWMTMTPMPGPGTGGMLTTYTPGQNGSAPGGGGGGVYGCVYSPASGANGRVDVILCPQPVNSTSTQNLTLCANTTLTLNANISGTALTYKWQRNTGNPDSFVDVANQTSATLSINSITTAETGTYRVIATDECDQAITANVGTVTVTAAPVAPTVQNITYCSTDTPVALTATGVSGAIFSWYGTSSTGGTASTVASIPDVSTGGTFKYYVTQKETEQSCESARAAITVTVGKPAIPTVSNLTLCQGATATALTASYVYNTTLQWYGTESTGGVSTTSQTPSTASVGTTTYYVSRKDIPTGCESARVGLEVTVNARAEAPTIQNASYCQSATAVALTATPSNGATLLWYGTNSTGGVSSGTAPTPNTATVGTFTYYVSQKTTATCESVRTPLTVTINALPSVSASSNSPVCEGGTLNLVTTVNGSTNNLAYAWQGPNVFTSTLKDPSITNLTTQNAGTYSITVSNTITNCSATATTNVSIRIKPKVKISSNSPVCEGGTINLGASSGNNDSFAIGSNTNPSARGIRVVELQYSWSGPNAFSSTLAEPSITNATSARAGVYTVSVQDDVCTTTATINVTITPALTPSVTLSPSAINALVPATLVATPVNGGINPTYTWSLNGQSISKNTLLNSSNGLQNNFTQALANSDTTIYVGTNGAYNLSTNNGKTFTHTVVPVLGDGDAYDISASGNDIYMAYGDGLRVSHDGGATYVNKTTTDGLAADYIEAVAHGNGKVYALTKGVPAQINISSDGGNTWTYKPLNTHVVNDIEVEGNNVYIATDDGLWVSNDGGTTFTIKTQSDGLIDGFNYAIEAKGDSVFAVSGGLSISTNKGNTFSLIQGTQNNSFTNVAYENGIVYIAKETGQIWVSKQPFTSFTKITREAAPYPIKKMVVSKGKVFATTTQGLIILDNLTNELKIDKPVASQVYTVTMTPSADVCVKTPTATASITVQDRPMPTALVATPATICVGQSTTLSATCAASTVQWYTQATGGTAIGTGSTLIQSPTANTTYYASCKKGATEYDRVSVSVTVNSLPVVSINNDLSVCQGTDINLTSSAATSHAWSGPNSFTSSLQNPSITNATVAQWGIYTVTVSNALGCTATATTAITINLNPTVTAVANVPACENKTFFLTCTPSNNNIVAFSWTGPNGFSSTMASPSKTNATLADTGTYSVTITTDAGCTATTTTSVTVNTQPQAPAITTDNSIICKNGSSTLTGTCSTSTEIFRWSTPPMLTNSLASSNQRVVTQPGVYKGVCESAAGCISSENTITITQASDCNGQNFLTGLPAKPFVCPNSSVTLTVSGCSGTITWLGGPSTLTGTSVSVSPTTTTTYFVQCSSGGSTTVDVLVASQNVTVSNNITTGTEKVKAVKTIESDKRIGGPGFTPAPSVVYEAGNAIILKPGFVADSWSTFSASIKACN